MNFFDPPYKEIPIKKRNPFLRDASQLECIEEPMKVVSNHLEAAEYILEKGACNGLDFHISNVLRNNAAMKKLYGANSLKPLPKEIRTYQQTNKGRESTELSNAIASHCVSLDCELMLYHGGSLPVKEGKPFTTSTPLSTSFQPEVALRNALWRGKTYKDDHAFLYVIKIINPEIRAFLMPLDGESHGHECEALLEKGLKLQLVKMHSKKYEQKEGNKLYTMSLVEVEAS
ncbi:hypothetical protein BB427_13695 [Pseudoalteromonas sp. BMB]|uniref:hypothetical protein n=1 Tax=Pseudoalteromonas sp. BMB TaxID=1874619 RepID=UPI00083D1D92|nr:hypothetical protein [Pseudoalteromonas sp. BMB]ODB37268.1 hypothetical protein BB427_13695 [Pseudoalteromonas sp. BMB]